MIISPSEVIAELLRELLIGTDPIDNAGYWPVYVGQMGEEPDQAITVWDIATPTQGRLQYTGETIAIQQFQVRVRDRSYIVVRKKAFEISNKFDTILRRQVSVDGKLYKIQCINQSMTPVYIGPDLNNRVSFTLNCSASIKEI